MGTINIFDHLASLDQGKLADLIKDVRIIELVSEIQKGRGAGLNRGELIADTLGGVQALLTDKKLRNRLFLSFSKEQEELIKAKLNVKELYTIRFTKERKKNLFGLFSVEEIQDEKYYISKEAVTAVGVEYGLFKHQSIALLEALKFLDDNQSVMLHMPTGAGKTRTAMHLIARYLNKIQCGIIIWLVHGVELCIQASSEFKKAWRFLGERPIPLIELWGGKKGCIYNEFDKSFENSGREIDTSKFENDVWPLDLEDAVIIASVDSINRVIDFWEPGERVQRTNNVRLVVFDEAHQAVATTYKRAVQSVGHKSALLGLSATPGRRQHGEYSVVDHELVNMFGGNKVDLQFPGYASPIEALIQQGYLAKLEKEKLEVVNSNLSSTEIGNIRRKLSTSLDVDEGFLQIVGLDSIRTMQIVEKVEGLIGENHKRIIVFAPSIQSANLISNLLRLMGVKAQSVTANTDPAQRNKYLSDYTTRSDNCYVLCNYGVLTTGFDAPMTSAVVIARPTTSIVLLSQMAGRAIRGPRVGGNEIAKMITVVDTAIPELVETINQFHAFDESWNTK